jgi:hypothetical protein
VKVATFGRGFCVLVCFFSLGLEGVCMLRLWDWRFATFNVDSMLGLLSVFGAEVYSAGSGLLEFRFSQFGKREGFAKLHLSLKLGRIETALRG